MTEKGYNRRAVTGYAKEWAFKRNPRYLSFDSLGGDCTNFASQCVFAGSGVMNPKKTFGWYYYSASNRTASWTGVEYLYNFLTSNDGVGPYATETDISLVEEGDLVQLGGSSNHFYHCPVIVKKTDNNIFVAAHTFDCYMRALSSYSYDNIRFLHIEGVRDW